MAQHFVCLTFDHDNTSGAISRELTTPTMLSRGDFGIVATARILELLRREAITTTWFIPGHTIESYPSCAAAVVEAGHEIADHGWTASGAGEPGREAEEAELIRGQWTILRLSGRKARGYRSPAWDLSPFSIELLLKHGFVYDSSLMGHAICPIRRAMAISPSSRSRWSSAPTRRWSRCPSAGPSTITRPSNTCAWPM